MTKRCIDETCIDRSTIVELLEKINNNRQPTCQSQNKRHNHECEHQWKISLWGSIEEQDDNRQTTRCAYQRQKSECRETWVGSKHDMDGIS